MFYNRASFHAFFIFLLVRIRRSICCIIVPYRQYILFSRIPSPADTEYTCLGVRRSTIRPIPGRTERKTKTSTGRRLSLRGWILSCARCRHATGARVTRALSSASTSRYRRNRGDGGRRKHRIARRRGRCCVSGADEVIDGDSGSNNVQER